MPTKVYAVQTITPAQVQPAINDARTVHHQLDAGDAQIINEPIHPKITLPSQDHSGPW